VIVRLGTEHVKGWLGVEGSQKGIELRHKSRAKNSATRGQSDLQKSDTLDSTDFTELTDVQKCLMSNCED